MAKFSLYKISLKSLAPGVHTYNYDLDRKFFEDIDEELVRKGNVKAVVTVKKITGGFEINIHLSGLVQVPCDRCLDDMNQEVESENRLIVKLGKEYSEESDEVIIIPEDEVEINLAWFLYEFVALNIPIKHVHEPGSCNRTMSKNLKKHRAVSSDDADEDNLDGDLEDDGDLDEDMNNDSVEQVSDPRWDALKGLNIEE